MVSGSGVLFSFGFCLFLWPHVCVGRVGWGCRVGHGGHHYIVLQGTGDKTTMRKDMVWQGRSVYDEGVIGRGKTRRLSMGSSSRDLDACMGEDGWKWSGSGSGSGKVTTCLSGCLSVGVS